MRPSRRAELAYKADLVAIVDHLRAAGAAVANELRHQWPTVNDSPVPSLQAILARMQHQRFGNTGAVAKRIAERAAKRTLTEVDASLTGSVKASIGVDISPILMGGGEISTAMATAARANVALITSIPEQYFDRLQSEITDSWAQGERWEAMVGRVQEIGDVTESRAKLIARDQVSKLNASFNEVRQKDLGIEKYRWDTAGDERVRESHQALNGQEFRWDDPPEVDGENVHPGEAINCRCVAVPIANLDEVAEHVDQLEAEAA